MARSRVRIYSKRYLCQSLSRSSIFGGNCSNARVSSCGFAIVLPFRSTQYDSRNSIALPCQSDKRAHPFYQMLLGREMSISAAAGGRARGGWRGRPGGPATRGLRRGLASDQAGVSNLHRQGFIPRSGGGAAAAGCPQPDPPGGLLSDAESAVV